MIEIRESTSADHKEMYDVHMQSFGEDKGPVIATLAMDLLDDETARPALSLVAVEGTRICGHIIFTKVTIANNEKNAKKTSAQILAPLAVLPDAQNSGIGGQLIAKGIQYLKESGVELIFVLGHPDYYPRHGFQPAGVLGFEAPYPIPEEHAGAWMVQELRQGIIGSVTGKIQCSAVLNRPEHWRE